MKQDYIRQLKISYTRFEDLDIGDLVFHGYEIGIVIKKGSTFLHGHGYVKITWLDSYAWLENNLVTTSKDFRDDWKNPDNISVLNVVLSRAKKNMRKIRR